MKDFNEYISKLKLPAYILFKNLRFEHDFDLDAPVSRGEIIANGSFYNPLREKLSRPVLPQDDYKQSLLDSKYGQIAENQLEYDDSIYDITEADPNDYEIFGKSFTIVFFCPPDEDLIVQYLTDQYKKDRNLIGIWSNYIDRLHIFPFYSLDISSDDFYENITDKFERALNEMPQPPTKQDWEELDDFL
jgi:hypothetical protein